MPKVIILICKLFLSFIALILLWLWAMWMFTPESAQEFYAVSQNSIHGINSLKSDFGGAVLTIAVFIGLYLLSNNKFWAYAAIISLSAIGLSRSFSLLVDGFTVQPVKMLLIELLSIFSLIILLKSSKNNVLKSH